MKSLFKTLLIPIVILLFVSGCRSTQKLGRLQTKGVDLIDPYTGTWDFVVRNTPGGDSEGVISIKKDGSEYLAVLDSDLGELPLNEISIQDAHLKGHFRYKGFKVNVKGVFQENILEGKLAVTLASFPLEAKKRAL